MTTNSTQEQDAFEKWCVSHLSPPMVTFVMAGYDGAPATSDPEGYVERLAVEMFYTNPRRNKDAHWHHTATPRKKYRDHARALIAAGVIRRG